MRILALLPCQPFPAYNGQTHRLGHVVRSLARAHEVSLACFVEPNQNSDFPDEDGKLFTQVELVEIQEPAGDLISTWRRRFGADPLDVVRLRSTKMKDHVEQTVAKMDPDVILTGDPALTQYVPNGRQRVVAMDYVCEATLQFERMRDHAKGLERVLWEGRRRKFVRFLNGISDQYDLVFLNSREDVDALSRYWDENTLLHIPNGLELDAYPLDLAQPVPGRLIYPGSVLYPPNRDAVEWFAGTILPKIRKTVPKAELRVTGAFDANAPQADGLVYTGQIDDVRVEIASAWATVVPLRLGAGGARFKVIESMALGSPIIGTAIGIEGLELEDGTDYLAAENAEDFARQCVTMLTDPETRSCLSHNARQKIEHTYNWQKLFGGIESRLKGRLETLRS